MTDEAEILIPSADRQAACRKLARDVYGYAPGKVVRVRVDIKRGDYTNKQRSALWGCAYKALKEQSDNKPELMHVYFCGEHFGWKWIEIMGERQRIPRRSTTKDERGKRDVIQTDALARFYDFVQRRAAENGFTVPDPDPRWFEKEGAKRCSKTTQSAE